MSKKKPDTLEVIKELIKSTDSRFDEKTLFAACIQKGLYKNIFDLKDELFSLEKAKFIYNIGGGQWCIPKPKNPDPDRLITNIKTKIKKSKK